MSDEGSRRASGAGGRRRCGTARGVAATLFAVTLPAVTLPAVTLLAGCSERDRLTFPTAPDGAGPVTSIDQPSRADTVVRAGPQFVLSGRTVDPDGVYLVNFLVVGGSDNTPPFRGGADTVRFGLPISTAGHTGDTLSIEIYGVDSLGNRGGSAFRRIFVE